MQRTRRSRDEKHRDADARKPECEGAPTERAPAVLIDSADTEANETSCSIPALHWLIGLD